jgi:formylglycine-generating enzyme required for sulfatase activity
MSSQSISPEDIQVLWQDERRVISMHAGSSPREADFAFASIFLSGSGTAAGELVKYVLRALAADPYDLPTPAMLMDGFLVRETRSGVRVVFLVTSKYQTDAESFLRVNLKRALHALGSELAGKRVWLPLMSTGAAGLSMEASLDITLETLHSADLGTSGQPARVQIHLPAELPRRFRQKLYQHAQAFLMGWQLSPAEMVPPVADSSLDSLLPRRRGQTEAPASPLVEHQGQARVALDASRSRPSKEQALLSLLADLFDDRGLRRWARLILGEEIDRALPGGAVAFDELCFQLVRQVQQRGLIDESFFAHLIEERPVQIERIRVVAWAWLDEQRASLPDTRLSAGHSSPDRLQARPLYADERTRALGEQLADAYARKQVLELAEASTTEVVQEILRLKRDIRSGGQLRPGDRLGDNRYLLLERIGRGGFANVWKALDQVSGRHAAVKVLHSELAGDVIRRERFFRGARVMTALEHPAVVRIIEPHGEDDGYHYFVMELATGGDLRHAVLNRRVDASNVVPLLLSLGSALAEAHKRGFVHRDIKPANVLLTQSGEPRLTDFDLVAATETTGGTRTGAMGTFLYAAPEILDRPQDADARADVYGLGMTAVFLLHGADLTTESKFAAAAFIDRLACDELLKRILQRAVAWEPEDRFADAAAFCQALREYAQPSPRVESSGKPDEQHQPDPGADLVESFVEPNTGIRFLLVPGGRFTMGAQRLLKECLPLHQVQISPFWLAETPVTRRQYEQFLHATNRGKPMLWSEPRFADPDQPVVGVSWMDVHTFCSWASQVSGLAVVFPSEAQWEFAARGPDARPYPWGEERPNDLHAHFGRHWLKDKPLPVGSLPGGRGPFGHLDQAGNVWEWCADVWDPSAYAKRGASSKDPIVWHASDEEMRVVRGGGFTSLAFELHAAYRNSWRMDRGAHGLGFRVAILPDPPERAPEAEEPRPEHARGGGVPSS